MTPRLRLAAAIAMAVAGVAIGVPMTAGASSAASGITASGITASGITARGVTARGVTATSAVREGHAAGPAAGYPAALTGLACRTLTHCVAVGADAPQMATQLIGEQWNGSRWSRSAMPRPAGTGVVAPGGVACPADHACVAVGAGYPRSGPGYFAIAEFWNGARWTVARAADPGSSSLLTAVSCPSARSCYAVGQYTPKGGAAWAPLIEEWNGRQWSRQAAPVPHGTSYGALSDVSCASATFCVAAGTDGAGALLERWNGSRWSASVPRSSSSAMLYGVSCPSAASCFAVGTATASGGALAERWLNGSWTKTALPVPSGSSHPWLQSLSCVSATRCLAVGDDLNPGVYADEWNGHGWHLVAMTATGGHLGELDAIRCLAATSCIALAQTTQISATQRSESAFWNGARWKVIPTA